jgi:hypothetical protein
VELNSSSGLDAQLNHYKGQIPTGPYIALGGNWPLSRLFSLFLLDQKGKAFIAFDRFLN